MPPGRSAQLSGRPGRVLLLGPVQRKRATKRARTTGGHSRLPVEGGDTSGNGPETGSLATRSHRRGGARTYPNRAPPAATMRSSRWAGLRGAGEGRSSSRSLRRPARSMRQAPEAARHAGHSSIRVMFQSGYCLVVGVKTCRSKRLFRPISAARSPNEAFVPLGKIPLVCVRWVTFNA